MRRFLPLCFLAVLVLGCSTSHYAYRQAEIATQRGNWDEAVVHYLQAVEEDPTNISYRAALLRAKIKASQEHFEKGKQYRDAGAVERALIELEQAVQLDPTNQYARAELDHARQAYQAARQNRQLQSLEEMKQKSRGSRPQPPELNPRSNEPLSIQFPTPVSIFDIYRALGKAFGINILFDPGLKDQEIAIELKNVDARSALETLMRASGHFYKVMDEQTIIIAADTPQNRRTYEDQVIQTFFLSNAEVKDMMTLLRSLVDAKKIAQNEQLNAIIMRDSADKVKVAERLIQSNDKSKAEVVVDVELLQINTGRLRDLGVSLSSYSVTQALDLTGGAGTGTGGGTGGSTGNTVRISDLEFINQSNWVLTIPTFLYEFVKTNSDAQLLAKPQLRITEGEKASLIIGDRVPIPLTTFNTQNAVPGGGIIPITSFQYQDVGIRIELEPRVHHNQEVTLKIKIEVSQINGRVAGSGGQEQPIIGTRTIDSTIRLEDGETNFLAGLIRTDETNTDTGIPGLSDIPVLGRLFSNKSTNSQRTDVILTMTPHIIRNAEITADDLLPLWVGTEANFSFRGGSPRVESEIEGPFDGDEGTPEQIEDAIRRRIQRLPPGLRPGEVTGEEGDEGVEQQQQPPAGVDLVPSAPPSDIFRPPDPEQPIEVPPPPPPGINQGAADDLGSGAAGGGAVLAASQGGDIDEGGGASSSPVLAVQGAPAVQAGGAAESVRLWFTPQAVSVVPGDRFEVRMEVSALDPISHLPLALSFDPALLAVEKVEPGDFLGGPDQAKVLTDASRPGRLVLGASRLGRAPGVAGSGLVARITFRAVAAGTTELAFAETRALDAALKAVGTVRALPATIVVTPGDERPRLERRTPAKPPREAAPSAGG